MIDSVYVYTLGCRLNQAESEAISQAFRTGGFDIQKDYRNASLIVVNTCTVTSKAEQKARRMIRLFGKTAEAVVVTGCYAQMKEDEIKMLGENIRVFSLKEKGSLLSLPLYLNENGRNPSAVFSFEKKETDPFVFDADVFSYHSRAYLKIQDGCDNHCAFCQTSVARGKSVSLPVDEVVKRAKKIERDGYHEIMLTGVNLTMYNHNEGGLAPLVEALLSNLGPDMRIRFSSLEADNVDDRLIETFSDRRIMPHFHLPVQSASNKVLARVERKYQIDEIEYIVRRIREKKDDPFISCDIITGLPGEEEEDYQMTKDFLLRMDFAAFHVFPYSPREKTALFGAKDKSEERVRDKRAEELRRLSEIQTRKYIARQEGKKVEVIYEKNGWGTSGNYLKVRVESTRSHESGELLEGVLYKINPPAVRII